MAQASAARVERSDTASQAGSIPSASRFHDLRSVAGSAALSEQRMVSKAPTVLRWAAV
jgi:hypothetical protein